MAHKLFLFNFFILPFFFATCNSLEPPSKSSGEVSLQLLDLSVTEIYFSVSLVNASSRNVVILKGNEALLNFNIVGNDTIILIDNLEESTKYKFKAVLKEGNITVDVSNELSITTLSPTNQNFTWQVFTFGNPSYGSSVLRDVSIIDENNIWVGGEVYQLDSLGQTDYEVYGAGHWNGSVWNLMKVPMRDYGNPRPPPSPKKVKTVQAIDNDVFVSSSANVMQYENGNWIERAFFIEEMNFNGQVIQMYGYSNDNIYCVGRNGTIYHITNFGWNEIESGTETYLADIWGCINPLTGEEIKYIAGRLLEVGDEFKILRIDGNDLVDEIAWNEYANPYSIWSNKAFPIFVSGSNFYSNKTNSWEQVDEVSDKNSLSVRGTGLNDIFVCGSFGLLAHYNGINWVRFDQIASGAIFGSVDIKGNTVCIVGSLGLNAIIVVGKRAN